MGEAGTTGAPAAVINAINDALAPLAARITEQPATPDVIVSAIRAASQSRRTPR